MKNEYLYIAEEILEEYASSYSQLEKDVLAGKLKEIVCGKIEEFAETLKEKKVVMATGGGYFDMVFVDDFDETVKEFMGAENYSAGNLKNETAKKILSKANELHLTCSSASGLLFQLEQWIKRNYDVGGEI